MVEDKIRVLVSGARGRMGQEVVRAVHAEDDLELVGEVDLGDDLAASIRTQQARVVVDFTSPEAAVPNTRTIIESGASPVVGTTGFRPEDIAALQEFARLEGRGGVIAPNFAIGAVLLMKLARDAARFFPDVELIELHHEQKLDAPSGTAIKTAEALREGLDRAAREGRHPAPRPAEQETVEGARGGRYLGIPVHSVRLPGFVAHQEVIFGGTGEILTLRHDAPSRSCFMPGVVLAVRQVLAIDELRYGLESLLAS